MDADREEASTHQCLCDLVRKFDGEIHHDRCRRAAGPDQPYCDDCYENGHHLLDQGQQVAVN